MASLLKGGFMGSFEEIRRGIRTITPSSILGLLVTYILIFAFLATTGLILFRMTFVDFVDNYELAYKYDLRDGKISVVGKTGYIVNPPIIVKVHTVDLRPMQVCINANKRVLNCKLVEFDPKGLEIFLSWHGRKNYSGDSTNTDGRPAAGGFNDILTSYAYDGSGKRYPFLRVIRELKPEEVSQK